MSELTEYERVREENIRKNKEVLASLHIPILNVPNKRPASSTSSKARKKPKPQTPRTPARRSLRQQGITPEGNRLPTPPPEPTIGEDLPIVGPIDIDESERRTLLSWARAAQKGARRTQASKGKGVSALRVKEEDHERLTPKRIIGMAVHPHADRLIVCAGDTLGDFGMWNVSTPGEAGTRAETIRAHVRSIRHIVWDQHNTNQIYTCSHDGMIRRLDAEKFVFENFFYDEDAVLDALDVRDHVAYVGTSRGDFFAFDVRSSPSSRVVLSMPQVHDRKFTTIQVDPSTGHYLATASNDTFAKIFDIRMIPLREPKKSAKVTPVHVLAHGRAVTSAVFSPDGAWLATSSLDNTVRTWANIQSVPPSVKKGAPASADSEKHNNETGRWITNFRVDWHPDSNMFAVGNMSRFVDIFSVPGLRLQQLSEPEVLTSIPAVNCFHPALRTVMFSGQGGGKVYVWR